MDSFRLLIDAAPEKTFYLCNGKPIRNLSELIVELEVMNDGEFSHHCNENKDDFATWIEDALRMGPLAEILKTIKDRHDYIAAIKSGKHPKQESKPDKESKDSKESKESIHEDIKETKHDHHVAKDISKEIKGIQKDALVIKETKEVPKDVKEIKEIKDKEQNKEQKDSLKESVPKSNSERYIKEVEKVKTIVENFHKMNVEFTKKVESLEKANSELSKKIDVLTKTNSELSRRLDDSGKKLEESAKANNEFSKKIDSLEKANLDSSKKEEILAKTITEIPISNAVSKEVAKYFQNKEFRENMVAVFNNTLTEMHLKYKNSIKAEIAHVAQLNNELEKKLESSMQNRVKQTEKIVQSMVSDVLNAKFKESSNKMDRMIESRSEKADSIFEKKAHALYSSKFAQFKDDMSKEKHDLRIVAAEAMNKEFDKIFADDAHVANIVARYQKMFTESLEHSAKVQKEAENKLKDELLLVKDKFLFDSVNALNKQLSDTVKKQREILDAELAKALSSNKYFVSRFEKEISDREKLLMEAADRKLEENYKQHDSLLKTEFTKYYRDLSDLKLQSEKDFKQREAQFSDSINSRIHESMNKEFDDILMNQRKELADAISTVRVNAINKIEVEFNDILSKHKHFLADQFTKANSDQTSLKEKFIAELRSEEEKMLSKVKEMLQKELATTVTNQRSILDSELTKTVLANKYFVERFEKEIMDMDKKLNATGNQMLEESRLKYDLSMQKAYDKQLESLAKMIGDADLAISNKEAKILANLNATIPASVREAVNKEFSRLIMDEKTALATEIAKAEETNRSIERKFETELTEKARKMVDTFSKEFNTQFGNLMRSDQEKLSNELAKAKKSYELIEAKKNEVLSKASSLIDNFNKEANVRMGELLSAHQAKLDSELAKTKKALETIEAKKSEMIEKTENLIDEIKSYSTAKLKDLEKEHDKHLKKVSKISELITKVEGTLNDVRELKAQVSSDKKNYSKESKEYTDLINELNDLRNNLSQEKQWLSLYREKVNVYNMIRQCTEFIRAKDPKNAKMLYNKIAKAYSTIPFDESDKAELYSAISLLLKETQKAFPEVLMAKE